MFSIITDDFGSCLPLERHIRAENSAIRDNNQRCNQFFNCFIWYRSTHSDCSGSVSVSVCRRLSSTLHIDSNSFPILFIIVFSMFYNNRSHSPIASPSLQRSLSTSLSYSLTLSHTLCSLTRRKFNRKFFLRLNENLEKLFFVL